MTIVRLKHLHWCRHCGQLVQLLSSGRCPLCGCQNR